MTSDTTLFPDLPPAGPYSPRERFESAVRLAATYQADEGTSGSLLSFDQFAAITAAADEYRAQALNELAAELRDEGERQRSVRHGLNFAATIAEMKAKAP